MRVFSFLFFIFLLCSCSAKNTNPPDVSLVDIQFGEVKLFETTLEVSTRVRNESPDPLDITGMVHLVSLNGIDLGKAISKERVFLRPLEARVIVATLEVSHLSLAFNLQELIESNSLRYELESEFFVAGFGSSSIRVNKEGTLISPGSIPAKRA